MLHRFFSIARMLIVLVLCLGVWLISEPAFAEVDPYVSRYLDANEPVALALDGQGDTRLFDAEQLSTGKQLFKQHCMSCHVGGGNVPFPSIPLSLEALSGATPPRDNINSLVAFMRQPMTYDGTEPTYWCREVPETWMPQEQIEQLAAFILRAAQKAPSWGGGNYDF